MTIFVWALVIALGLAVVAGLMYLANALTLSLDNESIEDWEAFGDAVKGGKK
jgi:hypothetical protein